jgi:hypothetical protein
MASLTPIVRVRTRIRDQAPATFTDQIAEAQRMAREWMAMHQQ